MKHRDPIGRRLIRRHNGLREEKNRYPHRAAQKGAASTARGHANHQHQTIEAGAYTENLLRSAVRGG